MALAHVMTPRQVSPWLRLEGALLILLGLVAVTLPLMAGIGATLLIGWTLIVAAIVRFAAAVSPGGEDHRTSKLTAALIALVAGILVITFPLAGAFGIESLIAGYLVVDGFVSATTSRNLLAKGVPGSGWLLAAGVLEILLGVALLLVGVFASVAVVGLVVGAGLIATGASLLFMRRAGVVPAL